MSSVLLPPSVNPVAVNKYIYIYTYIHSYTLPDYTVSHCNHHGFVRLGIRFSSAIVWTRYWIFWASRKETKRKWILWADRKLSAFQNLVTPCKLGNAFSFLVQISVFLHLSRSEAHHYDRSLVGQYLKQVLHTVGWISLPFTPFSD